ncbi:MAG: Murein DD-endopeptidase MepM [Alphaproteobacteria bacterium MarineAlpha2_Bin1]|nr:MAG: Murein DD-endopeptidase MepM [Alphaproteobacteria bacterium MarineAlpha2_Bin1]|tara:strand:+ start:323 stop:1156 length:834 start_codon:yes stop_codon:yes gene_type:complete
MIKSDIFMSKYLIIFFILLLVSSQVFSQDLNYYGELTQGGLIRGKVKQGTKVFLDEKPVKVSRDGLFVFGFGRNHRAVSRLKIKYNNDLVEEKILTIVSRDWKTQKIDNLPSKMVVPNKDSLKTIRDNNIAISSARNINSNETWFMDDFIWPVKGIITGTYGTKRILNGESRQPHYGIDIAAPNGTEVLAPARGRVTLSELGHYYTGGTIILDHGHGLSTAYLHLKKLNVTLGQKVSKGQIIGYVGSTGRSTGDHLDWRVNWFKVRIDPQLVVRKKM